MAHLEFSIFSNAVGGQTSISMLLPILERRDEKIAAGEKFQTLWLLHGGGGDCGDYVRNTAIELFTRKHKLAVIMPEVGNSFYSDMPDGGKYYTYVSKELPEMLRKYFPLSDKREDNFIAGLSMGGFGAAKIAFNNPQNYAAVGLMSTGPMGPHQLAEIAPGGRPNSRFNPIFGGLDKIPGSINDIWHVLKTATDKKIELPAIYNCCGTEDFCYETFCKFKEFAAEIGLPVKHEEGPGGHTWEFWNEYLPKIIDWLPLKNRDSL